MELEPEFVDQPPGVRHVRPFTLAGNASALRGP
jgi:hypothetical protein